MNMHRDNSDPSFGMNLCERDDVAPNIRSYARRYLISYLSIVDKGTHANQDALTAILNDMQTKPDYESRRDQIRARGYSSIPEPIERVLAGDAEVSMETLSLSGLLYGIELNRLIPPDGSSSINRDGTPISTLPAESSFEQFSKSLLLMFRGQPAERYT